jgi:hypothetical protein
MPSTYTTNLGIEKIATGEQSGTWGNTTNTNFDLLDQAINGVVQVTLSSAGSSGSPTDLPINDGAVSDGRNKFVEFIDGGDLGGTAYVRLTPNDAEKIVHIRNSLTASRSIIIFQGTYSASNDFEIPNGADVLLKFDGAGSGAVVSDVNVDLTVTGLTATSVDINGGNIDGTAIGAASASTGAFTTITTTGTATVAGLHVDATTAVEMPTGTQAQRPSAITGMLRFNTDLASFEGYNGTAWGSIGGGASGGGTDAVFYENDQVVTTDYTIASDKNAMSTGPLTINAGVTVTVSSGARWVVI